MSQISEFYAKVSEDEALKQQIQTIVGDTEFEELTDEQLRQIGELAKAQGFTVSLAEAKEFFAEGGGELALDALDAVAGGKGDKIKIDCRGRESGNVNNKHDDTHIHI